MMNKLTKCGLLSIVILMVATLGFVWVASADTIYINNASEWIEHISDFKSAANTIVLTGDIDFSDKSGYVVSEASANIDGYHNGKIHVISNFSISGTNYVGLIGTYYGRSICNITLRNFSISGSGNVGGLVGSADHSSLFDYVIVLNGEVTGSNNVGGLVGHAGSAGEEIVNCTVKNCKVSGSSNVGGLVGDAYADGLSINASCVDDCDLSASNSYVGGLVGIVHTASVYVNVSWVNGCDISAGYDYAGGLVGCAVSACTNIDIKNSGVVNCVVMTKSGYSGGCLGCNAYNDSNTRTVDNCTVRNCAIYATSNSNPCGGIIGGCVPGENPIVYPSVTNCTVKYCTVSAGDSNNAGGVAGSFPEEGKLDGNRVVCCCITSKKGNAAGICPAVA